MPPLTSVDDWTPDVVRRLAASPNGEPAWFDFKEFLVHKHDPKHNERLCSVVCAMANTGGGFLVFGVKDTAATPDEKLVGIPLKGEERHDFGQIVAKITPPVGFSDVKAIPYRDGVGFFVVRVLESPSRPHMNMHDNKFYRRGEGGNATAMSYYEVRDQMVLGEERRGRVALFAMKLAQYHRIARIVGGHADLMQAHLCFDRFDTITFETLLSQVILVIPKDNLIEHLTRIVELAIWANTALALAAAAGGRGGPSGLNEAHHIGLGARATEIQRLCLESHKRLEELFGPLPPRTQLQGY